MSWSRNSPRSSRPASSSSARPRSSRSLLSDRHDRGSRSPRSNPTMAKPRRREPIWDLVSKVKLRRAARLSGEGASPDGGDDPVEDRLRPSPPSSSARFPASQRNDLLCRMLAHQAGRRRCDRRRRGRPRARSCSPRATRRLSHAGIANILNKLDKSQSEDVLKNAGGVRPDDAKTLKSMLFSFDDLVKLSQSSQRTVVFDQVPIERAGAGPQGHRHAVPGDHSLLAGLALAAHGRGGAAERRRGLSARCGGGAPAIVDIVLKMVAKGEIDLKAPDPADEEAV